VAEVDDMARARQSRNGRLEDALATLLQTQASMQQTQVAFFAQMAEMKAESDRRFARIEAILLEHTRILQEHSRILAALPDAVREKIGFKGTGQQG
jgi:hypothetical protein